MGSTRSITGARSSVSGSTSISSSSTPTVNPCWCSNAARQCSTVNGGAAGQIGGRPSSKVSGRIVRPTSAGLASPRRDAGELATGSDRVLHLRRSPAERAALAHREENEEERLDDERDDPHQLPASLVEAGKAGRPAQGEADECTGAD